MTSTQSSKHRALVAIFLGVILGTSGCDKWQTGCTKPSVPVPPVDLSGGSRLPSRSETFTADLRTASEEQIRSMTNQLLSESRQPFDSVVHLWLGSDKDMSAKAMSVLLRAQEQAVVPLLRAQPAPVADKAIALQMAVDAELALRRQLVIKVDTLLDDKSVIPQSPTPVAEEKAPVRRVCDEAFLKMKEIVNFGTSDLARISASRRFLGLDDAEKDAEIQKFRQSPLWQQALHGTID